MNWIGSFGDWIGRIWGSVWSFLHGLSADVWTATAGWMTASIALVTVVVAGKYAARQVEEAKNQVQEAQKTRTEQAQPNVVAYTESNVQHWQALELVIKNYGSTPAHNVRIEIVPKPEVSPHHAGVEKTDLWYPEVIPFLAPWQEWRALWDYAPHRMENPDLESLHEATVYFEDQHGQPMKSTSVLDWNSLEGTNRLTVKSVHNIANLLEKQNELLKGIAEILAAYSDPKRGVWTFGAEAGPELQAREDAEAASWNEPSPMLGLFGAGNATPAQPDEPRDSSSTTTGQSQD